VQESSIDGSTALGSIHDMEDIDPTLY